MMTIACSEAREWLKTLEPKSVHLLCIDPPYYNITDEDWDNAWASEHAFVAWLTGVIVDAKPALTDDASVVFFGGIGKHKSHPLFEVIRQLEEHYFFRNMITWKKRRGYGKSHDYLFTREEFVWMSVSEERTKVRFNIPLTKEIRGYDGFNPKYPAKSPFKRVSNVWIDIPELMRPQVKCEKPVDLMRRIIETHSNEGDTIVDCFCGSGSTAVACTILNRNFLGCDASQEMVDLTHSRIAEATARATGTR